MTPHANAPCPRFRGAEIDAELADLAKGRVAKIYKAIIGRNPKEFDRLPPFDS